MLIYAAKCAPGCTKHKNPVSIMTADLKFCLMRRIEKVYEERQLLQVM